ncbi:MAG: MATE family Na+-driven efflux transporter [Candidatus Kariarchaeaceae archaeon]
MKKIITSLKTVNYRLYFALIFTGFLPTLYTTVRIFYLGDMPGDWGFNIASQMAWVGLVYEIVQEALILPLFFLLGKSLSIKDEFENKVRTGLFVTFGIYFIISLILIIFTKPLVVLMAQNVDLIDATVSYVRIESVAALFSTLTRFIILVLVTMKKPDYMYYLLGVQMFMSVLLDTFLVSGLSFSLNIGVNGIAISNIIVNITMLTIAIVLLNRENIRVLFNKTKPSFEWLKEWYQVGKFSGLESFFRNLAFMVMIIRIVNEVSEQGSYWVANNFIWFWLLLPVLALGDLVKKEVGEDIDNIRTKTFGYFIVVTIIVIAWLISIPVWKPFLQYVMNISEYEKVYGIVTLQLVFYITFAYNSIMDSTFYGVGKTNYMLYQSLIIDVFYYGIAFILYITKSFTPTLTTISLMFGIGMVLDFIPTTILYRKLLREKKIQIQI